MTPCNTLCTPTHFSMNKCKTSQALLQNFTGVDAKLRRRRSLIYHDAAIDYS